MELGEFADDRESESDAAGVAAAGLLRPPDPVEHVRQVRRADARARVGHSDDGVVSVRVRDDVTEPPGGTCSSALATV